MDSMEHILPLELWQSLGSHLLIAAKVNDFETLYKRTDPLGYFYMMVNLFAPYIQCNGGWVEKP